MNPFLVVQQNLLKFFNFKREFVVFVASGNDDDDDDDDDGVHLKAVKLRISEFTDNLNYL